MGTHAPHRLGAGFGGHGADPGPQEQVVQTEIDVRYPGYGGETQVVLRIVDPERADVVERAALETGDVVADDQIALDGVRTLWLNDQLIETGRQQIDQVDVLDELRRFLPGDLAGHEDAEMADIVMQVVDDRLLAGADVVDALVQVEDPAERLLGRRDVVAERGEYQDRRADVAQIHPLPVPGHDLAGGQLVADEQFVGDGLDLLPVQQEEAAPPFLELQVALFLGVDPGIQVVRFAPVGVAGIEFFKVLHQQGAIEAAIAQIAGECGQPGAAGQAPRVTHRVLPFDAGPV